MSKLRIAVMASGGGSNLQKLLDRFPDRDDSPAEARVALVVSDRPGAGALDRARKAGVRREVIEPKSFSDQEAFGQNLIELYGEEKGKKVLYAEAFELCEYGTQPSMKRLKELFPFYEK